MSAYPFRTALVTGASSGIGEVIVRELAAAGVSVVVVARRRDRLETLAAEFAGIEVLVADLVTAEGQALVCDRVADPERAVELVVNNAGFGTTGLFSELNLDRLSDEIELNLGALTRISHAALNAMVPRGVGWLLNVSSIASFQPAPRLAVYAATKAYVTSLTESIHDEVASSGVRVTALCPGLTRTEFQRVSNTERYADRFPGFAWTNPHEVARTGLADVVANKVVSVPGLQYKALTAAADVTPRWLRRRVSSLVQRR